MKHKVTLIIELDDGTKISAYTNSDIIDDLKAYHLTPSAIEMLYSQCIVELEKRTINKKT